ncbi:uncharacterized protein LOC100678361 isoform X2 [Nasonia vitripennis]|nr:uncharacterized protein LOC100678361 isoform X2 [Nasonia vitripennis]
MFLVCSGGGWWYRYWLQGRYRAAASAIPTRSSSSRTQNPLRGPTCQAQQARITYNTARNTVLLHRMWKAQRSASSPAYSAAGAASSAAHYQNTSVVLNDANCPYYQLYGPPPSYETVIAQTRGKISSPSSPELQPRSSPAAQPAAMRGCFYPTVPSLLPPPPPPPPLEAPQYQASPPKDFDTAEYVRLYSRLQQQYSPRHQLYQPAPYNVAAAAAAYDRSAASDNSDVENSGDNYSQANSPDDPSRFPAYMLNCPANRKLHHCYAPTAVAAATAAGKFTSRVGVHGMSRRDFDSPSSSQSELGVEPVATTSLGFEGCATIHRSRKLQGGSLKIPRRRDQQGKQQQHETTLRNSRRLSSTDCEASSSREPEVTRRQQPEPQSSPSSHVILAANATSKSGTVDDQRNDHHHHHHHSNQQQQQQQQPAATIAERSSTNSNLESKRKLDRSRSLD